MLIVRRLTACVLFLSVSFFNPSFSVHGQDAAVPALVAAGDPAAETFDISLTPEEKEYLSGIYRDTWNYLGTFVDPMTGIPYDSDKKQPATSLSNVGLYFGATAIAYRTGLIGKEEALSRIRRALVSLDKVEKWRGIPRVWFTARSLKPIRGTEMFSYSKHVSNLLGGLILARATFPVELGADIDAFMSGMDLASMYNAANGWLKGGYDVRADNYAVGQPFGNWYYKFLASEARLISFYLVAKGAAPVSHWEKLIRPVQKKEGTWYFVPGYEDGGAYMPYMASLYIDERHTLMGASQKNYSEVQRKHAAAIGAPVWGWSASLDTKGEYVGYGELRDEIVTPYASMLAVIHYPREVVANLKELEKLNARPQTQITDLRGNFAAFTEKDGMIKPWAMSREGEVLFLDKTGTVQKLSGFLTKPAASPGAGGYDPKALTALAKALGYSFQEGQTIEDLVTRLECGAGANFDPSLAGILADSAQREKLSELAEQAGYAPGCRVTFKDGKSFYTACSAVGNIRTPLAISGTQNAYFTDLQGVVRPLSNYIRSSTAVLPNTVAQGLPAASTAQTEAPPVKSSSAAYDPANLFRLFEAAGSPLKSGQPVEKLIKSVALKQVDHEKLSLSLPPALAAEALLGIGGKAGLKPGCQIRFRDGRIVEALCLEENNVIQPWAIIANGDVFFIDSKGAVDQLSKHINAVSKAGLDLSYDRETLTQLASQVSGHSFPEGQPLEDTVKEIFSAEALRQNLASIVPGRSAEELLTLGGKAGLSTAGFVILSEAKTLALGFRDAVNWKTGAVAENYLTPSQGMAFLALANVLHQGIVWKSFAEDGIVQKALPILRDASQEVQLLSAQAGDCFCGIQQPDLKEKV